MEQSSSHDNELCPKSPLVPAKGHLFITDKDDKRFKVCSFCQLVAYRSDEELLEGTKRGKRT